MADPTDTAEAALERLRRILARWPRVGEGQGVRADAVLAGLAPLGPIATMVLGLPRGYGKGYYQGAGYLSGSSRITDADLALARAVVQDIGVILPAAGERALTRELYSQIKTRAYKLLGLATDLDVSQSNLQKLGTAPGAAWDTWVSLKQISPVVRVGAAAPKAVDSPIAQKAEAAIQRVLAFTRAFPHPTAMQRVTVASAAKALEPLRPLAVKIAAMSLGTKKGTVAGSGAPEALARVFLPLYNVAEAIAGKPQPATGYLTGPTITEDDRTTARFILHTLDATLPLYTSALLEPGDYEAIRKGAHQLLLIATDLDLDTTLADKVTLAWESAKESVKDLAAAVQQRAEEGWSLLKVGVVVAAAAAGIYGVKTALGK